MKDIVSQFAMQLTLAEKRELVAELKGAIAEELASRASGPAGPSRCPRCGSPSLVRKGRDRDGGQRWLCRGCARTFSARTRGLLASSVSVNVFFAIFTNFLCQARQRGAPFAPTYFRHPGYSRSGIGGRVRYLYLVQ